MIGVFRKSNSITSEILLAKQLEKVLESTDSVSESKLDCFLQVVAATSAIDR